MKRAYRSDARGIAFNVKVHRLPDVDGATDDQYEAASEITSQKWWAGADAIAKRHGFTEVFSAGRMGGWCYPVQGRSAVTEDDLSEDAELSARFDAFETDLAAHLATAADDYADNLASIVKQDAEADAHAVAIAPHRAAVAFLAVCDERAAGDEFFRRLAGSVRKAAERLAC